MIEPPVKFIAEIADNHQGRWEIAKELIRAAKSAGFYGVKFQLYRVDSLFSPEALRMRPELQKRRATELPLDWLPKIRKSCDQLDLKFGCTPLYLKAVQELEPYVDFLKIASYETRWKELVHACLEAKPTIISTGLSTNLELSELLFQKPFRNVTNIMGLLHCVSMYPAPFLLCNLQRINDLKCYGRPVGWSDHTGRAEIIKQAVLHWGAEIVELHISRELSIDPRIPWDWARIPWDWEWYPKFVKKLIELCQINGPVPQFVGDEVAWMRDPDDGLRPLKETRRKLEEQKDSETDG